MTIISNYSLGLLFILVDCIIWAGASVLMQHIYEGMEFHSPFFLTFLTNSLLMLHLIVWACSIISTGRFGTLFYSEVDDPEKQHFLSDQIPQKENYESTTHIDIERRHPTKIFNFSSSEMSLSVVHSQIFRIAGVMAPLYVLSNGLYNYSLFKTSISSSTIISNLSGAFAFSFSWYLGMEAFSYSKVAGILVCFCGALCVGLSDAAASEGGESVSSLTGDCTALGAAVFFGMYTAVLKYMVPSEENTPMPLLLGYIGLINVVCLSPLLTVVSYTGLECFSDLTWAVVGLMCVSGFCNNVISDYLWGRSVVLTSSTVATVGLSMTIPLAMLADYLVQDQSPTVMSAVGAVLVVTGFCLVNVSMELEKEIMQLICAFPIRTAL